MGMAAILVMWPGQFIQTFIPPSQECSMWSLTLNGQAVSKKKMSEHCERTTTTTTADARALVYYKLIFWASRLRWANKPEDHWSCIAHLISKDMLKSAVIEEKMFKHSPWAGADNPLGPKFWCQQVGLITMVICCKFTKNPFNLWLYTHLFMI